MRTVALSILLAAATLGSAAVAQEAPAPPAGPPASSYSPTGGGDYMAPTYAPPSLWSGMDAAYRRQNIGDGVAALKAKAYTEAEEIFGEFLRYNKTNADANFYMGVTKMNLGEWEDAKKTLEIAVKQKPKHPDPKSRLGVTYARLGDVAAANAQRAQLVKMHDACKNTCRLSPYITGGIEMIDEALAKTPANPAGQG